MSISQNEIRTRARKFAHDFKDETREEAEAKPFWDAFFQVFGIERREVASYEEPVRNLKGKYGFIDLFWKGVVLVEHKSKGKSLDKALSQAHEYIQSLARDGRRDEIPRYVLLSDFSKMALYDLEDGTKNIDFPLKDLPKRIQHFKFLNGGQNEALEDGDDANFKASQIMGDLHDALKGSGYTGHDLERMLVRILFCLFAEDSAIFEAHQFRKFVDSHTKADGSDTGAQLARLFSVLNTPQEKRQSNLDEDLAAFPYVNGDLFGESLQFADFNKAQRDALVAATKFNWQYISPAIFGSLFQGVMDAKARRQAGAHYTNERDILKVIGPLFLDDLKAEFEAVKSDKRKLAAFHEKMGQMKFFDPACGCGNFLIIAYREMRLLEIEVLKAQKKDKGTLALDVSQWSKLDVSAMYGIEIEEWPAMIAEVSLWLMDHQMNLKMAEAFGGTRPSIPLRKSAKIVFGNALRVEWKDVCPAVEGVVVLGNPPFVGKHLMSAAQGEDMAQVWGKKSGVGVLDFVTAWYAKAADYIQGTRIPVAFVSTNSIAQGEQVSELWGALFKKGIKIHFAHRTFQWQSEAKGKAHVHVVIVGFGAFDREGKRIFEYEDGKGEAVAIGAQNIGPYLVTGGDVAVENRSKPICDVPGMVKGSQPTDGGNLLLSDDEKKALVKMDPQTAKWIRPFLGADEFINGVKRWCLWLVDISPAELRAMPEVMERVERVREMRLASTKKPTVEAAKTPALFTEIRQSKGNYLLIPSVSSEKRTYVPIGYMDARTIVSNLAFALPSATLYHFAILTSQMHMAWMRQVCGRLKSDYRYSNKIVYNNFPWPTAPTEAQVSKIERLAQAILDARAAFPDSTLADLYDPVSMPPALAKAHGDLDAAVDALYQKGGFASDRERVEHLFKEYERLTAAEEKVAAKDKKKKSSKKVMVPAAASQ